MKKKSEKLLLDVDDQGAETERENDETHGQILLNNASVGASVEPEQEDFSNTRRALNMGDRQMGEIELNSYYNQHIVSPAMSQNYGKQAPGNSVVCDMSMSV